MRTQVKRQPKPTNTLHVRRQEILDELVQIDDQIAQVQKEMAQLEERQATLVQRQRRAA